MNNEDEGEVLSGDAEAHGVALKAAEELADSWGNRPPTTIVVKDETGRVVTEVSLPPKKPD